VIRLERVGKKFGAIAALSGVSFTVDRGEVVGIVGPNGAGKTTALRIITGFIDADEGRVEVAGYDVDAARSSACAELGYLPESVPLYDDMRVGEYLAFRARIKRVKRSEVGTRVGEVIAEFGLQDRRRQRIAELSKGYRQRVGLADALVARPPVLILDEPFAGLDPVQVHDLRGRLRELAAGHTILFASHLLPEVAAIASRLVVIVGGRIVADGTIAELRTELGMADDSSFEEVFIALAGDGSEGAGGRE
jgi:ABC-2 type transport system ATP-binding protein